MGQHGAAAFTAAGRTHHEPIPAFQGAQGNLLCLQKSIALDDIDAVMKAYKLYAEQMQASGVEPLLTFTRAWRLSKFMDANMLTQTKCTCCGGSFVTDVYENARHYVCGLCNPPARAGKGKADGTLRVQH